MNKEELVQEISKKSKVTQKEANEAKCVQWKWEGQWYWSSSKIFAHYSGWRDVYLPRMPEWEISTIVKQPTN